MIDTFFEGIVAVLNRLGIILAFMIFFLLCFSLLLGTCKDDIVNLTIKICLSWSPQIANYRNCTKTAF